jgi:hypothetical protein
MIPIHASEQGPCKINGNFHSPPNAVAFVHTHPFRRGEVMTGCGPAQIRDPSAPGGSRDMVGADGKPVYDVYRNRASGPDRLLLDTVNTLRRDLNDQLDQLAGVIIDANQMAVYTEDAGAKPVPLPRCGY